MTEHSHCCTYLVKSDEARLAASEEEQQRLHVLQEVEQWKIQKMFHARGMQIPQLQNENKQLQDIKCECMCINYNVANASIAILFFI